MKTYDDYLQLAEGNRKVADYLMRLDAGEYDHLTGPFRGRLVKVPYNPILNPNPYTARRWKWRQHNG